MALSLRNAAFPRGPSSFGPLIFTYERHEIRLVTMRSGGNDDEIQCEIVTVSLEGPTDDSTAFDVGRLRKIVLKCRTIPIDRKTYKLLSRLRYENSNRTIWIDNLCGIQHDPVEEMRLMQTPLRGLIRFIPSSRFELALCVAAAIAALHQRSWTEIAEWARKPLHKSIIDGTQSIHDDELPKKITDGIKPYLYQQRPLNTPLDVIMAGERFAKVGGTHAVGPEITDVDDKCSGPGNSFNIARLLGGIPTLRIIRSADLDPMSWTDKVKLYVECLFGEQIAWWPLDAPERQCPAGRVRVSWKCTCGSRLYFDIPEHQSESLQELLRSKTHRQVASEPILPSYNIHRLGSSSQNSISSSTPTGGIITGPDTIGSESTLSHGNQRHAASARKPTIEKPQSSTEGYIHWCVDEDATMTRLTDFDTKTICEDTLIPKMLETYATIRGWRNVWTLSTCIDVIFVKFGCMDSKDTVECVREALPPKDDQEYAYESSEPLEVFEKCLRSKLRHGLIKGKICFSPGPPDFSLQHLPRKVPERMIRKLYAAGYGLYAVSGRSFWKLAILFVLSQLLGAVFAVCWLLRHPDDLQNAFLIFLIVIAFLSYFRPSTRVDQALRVKTD